VVDNARRHASEKASQALGIQRHCRVPPEVPPILADTSKLYAQVVNRLPRNCPTFAVMASSASAAAW